MELKASEGAVEADRDEVLVRLVSRYSAPLSSFFARRVSSPAEVPDLVQDVFLRLSRMSDPQAIERPDSFLFTTASNLLRDRSRRASARPEEAVARLDCLEKDETAFPPDRVLDGRRAARRLAEALAALPERTRDVFVLRTLEGMKMAEVADAMGISTRAAEKHQARALAHVTTCLKDWRP